MRNLATIAVVVSLVDLSPPTSRKEEGRQGGILNVTCIIGLHVHVHVQVDVGVGVDVQ